MQMTKKAVVPSQRTLSLRPLSPRLPSPRTLSLRPPSPLRQSHLQRLETVTLLHQPRIPNTLRPLPNLRQALAKLAPPPTQVLHRSLQQMRMVMVL